MITAVDRRNGRIDKPAAISRRTLGDHLDSSLKHLELFIDQCLRQQFTFNLKVSSSDYRSSYYKSPLYHCNLLWCMIDLRISYSKTPRIRIPTNSSLFELASFSKANLKQTQSEPKAIEPSSVSSPTRSL